VPCTTPYYRPNLLQVAPIGCADWLTDRPSSLNVLRRYSLCLMSGSALCYQVVYRAASRDPWGAIGLGPELTPELAERRIASFAANGSQLEYAFIAVSTESANRAEAIRKFTARSLPALAPACPMSSVLVWSGIERGWLPAASPRPHTEAIRFASLLRKVRGDRFTYKIEAIK